MALSAGQYVVNGLARDTDGTLLTIVYSAGSATTYFIQNGLLLDADCRVVLAA